MFGWDDGGIWFRQWKPTVLRFQMMSVPSLPWWKQFCKGQGNTATRLNVSNATLFVHLIWQLLTKLYATITLMLSHALHVWGIDMMLWPQILHSMGVLFTATSVPFPSRVRCMRQLQTSEAAVSWHWGCSLWGCVMPRGPSSLVLAGRDALAGLIPSHICSLGWKGIRSPVLCFLNKSPPVLNSPWTSMRKSNLRCILPMETLWRRAVQAADGQVPLFCTECREVCKETVPSAGQFSLPASLGGMKWGDVGWGADLL